MFVLTHKLDHDCYWTSDAEVRQIGQSGHYLYDLNQVLVFPTGAAAREWLWLLPDEGKTPDDWASLQYVEFERRAIESYLELSADLREQMTAAVHDYLLDFYIYDTEWRRLRAANVEPPFKKAADELDDQLEVEMVGQDEADNPSDVPNADDTPEASSQSDDATSSETELAPTP